MNSNSLFLFKTEKLNLVNLLQFCFILSRNDLYEPCIPNFESGQLTTIKGKFIYDSSSDDPDNFRNIKWESKTQIVVDALTCGPLVLGNHSIEQLYFLKEYFKENSALIITCSYTADEYEFFLEQLVKQHIYLQDAGFLPLSQVDKDLRSSVENIKIYYKNSFDKQQLLPKEMQYFSDYNVPLIDFYDEDKFFQHLQNLPCVPTQVAIDYYHQWQKINNTLETYYETI